MTHTIGVPLRTSTLGPVRRTGFRNAVAFEWIKIRSVRSTLWTLAAAGVIFVAFAMLAGNQVHSGADVAGALGNIQGGIFFGQVAICVFGVLVATAEYGTGTISSSFTAVPARTRLLAAKALLVWAISTVVGQLVAFAGFFAGVAMLPAGAAQPSISDGSVLRAVIGMGIFLGVLGVFSLALGLIMRASAGAITAAIGVTLVAPIAFLLLGSFGTQLTKWWPTQAGQQIMHLTTSPDALSPWTGLGYFTLVTAIVLAGAIKLVNRRDA